MSLPFKYDLTYYDGETLLESFVCEDAYGNPTDLTGYEAKMQVRESAIDESDTPLLELSTDNGGIVIDYELGRISLHYPSLDTSMSGFYDLALIDGSGVKTWFISPKSKFNFCCQNC